LLHDNARPHIGKEIIKWIETLNVDVILLSRITEHIWTTIKLDVEKKKPLNLSELKKAITESWNGLTLSIIALITFMKKLKIKMNLHNKLVKYLRIYFYIILH